MKKVTEIEADGITVIIYRDEDGTRKTAVVYGAEHFWGTTATPAEAGALFHHMLNNEERRRKEAERRLKEQQSTNTQDPEVIPPPPSEIH